MLRVPKAINELVAAGRWPANREQARAQHISPLATPSLVRALASDEDKIYLEPPPFCTVAQCSETNPFWTMPMAAPEQLDFELALVVGDFGLGSDSPIVLDYRYQSARPRVLRLKWAFDGPGQIRNHWVELAPGVEEFAAALRL